MRLAILCVLAVAAAAGDLRTGFELRGLTYEGPGEWRLPVAPVWVYEYGLLRVRYRATGLAGYRDAVLSLRPGSIGPVTPGGTNPENPFVMGAPVTAIAGPDLLADGSSHVFETDLRPRLRTAQMDQLAWKLPAGARLEIEELEFRAIADPVSCEGLPLPPHAAPLKSRGPLACGAAAATSLRGHEAIRIETTGAGGRSLYLSLTANYPALSNFIAGQTVDRWRAREIRETAWVIARLRYEDRQEEQFPLLVPEARYALLNRKPALYVLELEPARSLRSVELLDRSEHVQLVLHAAGISRAAPPQPQEETPPAAPAAKSRSRPPALDESAWFRIEAAPGKAAPSRESLQADLRVTNRPEGRVASLSLTNKGSDPLDFHLIFPASRVEVAQDPADVYYVFPRQGAVISRREAVWEATYTAAFPLQFLDAFAPVANSGAALIIEDLSAQLKVFRLEKKGAAVRMEVTYPVRLAPGETFQAPQARVVFHGGDWREGFNAYRQWVSTWYRPAGPRPSWLRDAWWCRRDYPLGGSGRLFDAARNRYTFDELIRDGDAFGGIDFIDISGWALSETYGRVGDYPIELGGPEDLRANIARAEKQGIHTGLYFEGYLVDKNSRAGRENIHRWQLIGPDGKGAWWPGGSPEFFVCPAVKDWQEYFARRVGEVARQVGAHAVYIDQHGFGTRRCYAADHGHPPGVGMIPYEIEMARQVRRRLDEAGMRPTAIYLEETPVDAAAPYYDAAFCYSIPHADVRMSPAKLNLWRFVFTDVRLWDMLSIGVQPRPRSLEDFRLSLWHGNGVWLKGYSETWYGEQVLDFLRGAHELLRRYSAAFNGEADPLVASPHRAVLVNRFRGGGQTVYTLFNSSYRTVRFRFQGRPLTLAPRDVAVVEGS